MIQKYSYSIERYRFIQLISELYGNIDLQYLHDHSDERYDVLFEPGKDSDTVYHKIFYDKMRDGWPEMLETYRDFVREVVAPTLGLTQKLLYQKWPTFRVHLPNNVAVGGWHRDLDYNHPKGEINLIVAITPMFESNTTIAEATPGKMDFRQIDMVQGEFTRFNGNQCLHGNLPNKTGVTRVSFDFRVLDPKDYNSEHSKTSLSRRSKFVVGDYYEEMSL